MMKKLFILFLFLNLPVIAHAQGVEASKFRNTTFTKLGTPANGQVRHCTDCAATAPCTGSGTGADAYRVAGAWNCNSGAAGVGTVTTSGSPASPQLAKFSSSTAITTATATDVSTPSQCADAGVSDTYACNLAPTVASYVVGTKLRFFANTANTGGASINFNSVGALTIVKMAGGITTALATGDINAGQWVEGTIATGSNFQMTSQVGGSAGITNSASNGQVAISDGTNIVGDSDLTFSGDTLSATKITGAHNGTLGATTPSSVAATTVNANGTLTGVDAVLTPANTTGSGVAINNSVLTTGNTLAVAASGTAAASSTKTALNVATSGANANSAQVTFGAKIDNSSTGTTSTNIGLNATASGGTNLYPLVIGNNASVAAASGNAWFRIQGSNTSFTVDRGGQQIAMDGTFLGLGSSTELSWGNAIAWSGGDTFLFRGGAAANIRQGAAASDTAPIAQTSSVQNTSAGGTSNIAGADRTYAGSQGKGTGTGGGHLFKVAPAGSTGTVVNALSTAFSISGEGLVATPLITTDATHTDTAICQDTTTHVFYSGSGTLGVCLGTSTLRAKRNVLALNYGLAEVMKLQPISFNYREGWGYDAKKTYYGFGAEMVRPVLPELVGLDARGQANSVDLVGMIPLLVRSIQQQQEQIAVLQSQVRKLSHHRRR